MATTGSTWSYNLIIWIFIIYGNVIVIVDTLIHVRLHIYTLLITTCWTQNPAIRIELAGRADLVCLARPHLADPYWTLHAAAAIGDRHAVWPLPYEAGRDQAWRLADREAEMAQA